MLRSAELKTAAHQLKGLLGLIPEIQAIEDEAERRSALDNDFKPKAQQVIDHAQVRICQAAYWLTCFVRAAVPF